MYGVLAFFAAMGSQMVENSDKISFKNVKSSET
jgi:hypothetical protein